MISLFNLLKCLRIFADITASERIKKEEWWMKELKTLYPYGLNGKCGNNYFSSYSKDRLVYSVFNYRKIHRGCRGKSKNISLNFKTDNAEKVYEFVQELTRLIKKDKKWRHFCYSFIIRNSLQILTKLKNEYAFPKIITDNKNVRDFLSDLINKRFIHKNEKSFRSNFIKIHFENTGIEDVNITKLLYTVNDAIPESFFDRKPPTVLFTRTSCIGSKIFNYKNVVENLDTKCNVDDFTCDCSNSKLCDPDHGHIVTGNLDVITNRKLRSLLA